MFGTNTITGKKFFAEADGRLFVTSVFYTLQGEGPYRGEPAVFIRLAKCNLACSFCDAYFDKGEWFTREELERKIYESIEAVFGEFENWPLWMTDNSMRYKFGVVITGGEPAIQDALGPILQNWDERGLFSWQQIESNGTSLIRDLPESTTLVVSPKCVEKGGVATKYLKLPIEVTRRVDCYKFLLEDVPSSPYYTVPEWAIEVRRRVDVFVSPINRYHSEPLEAKKARAANRELTLEERSTIDEVVSWWTPGLLDMEANKNNHVYAARYALENGLIFQMQLHLFAALA